MENGVKKLAFDIAENVLLEIYTIINHKQRDRLVEKRILPLIEKAAKERDQIIKRLSDKVEFLTQTADQAKAKASDWYEAWLYLSKENSKLRQENTSLKGELEKAREIIKVNSNSRTLGLYSSYTLAEELRNRLITSHVENS